jgi:TolB-like protein/Tfp pilus assembly protein PilF
MGPGDRERNGDTAPEVLREVADRIADDRSVPWADVAPAAAADSRLDQLQVLQRVASAFRGAAAAPAKAAPVSFHWGHLEVGDKLGEGGFGDVYRAYDRVLDRTVALKLSHRTLRETSARRHLDEARRLARVRHPNVLTVYGADLHDGRVGLWTDLIEGETLEEVLDSTGPLSAREAAGIGLDLCRALASVHASGLVHGDVKAANVMRERGGRIVLMDFGTVKEIAPEGVGPAVSRGTPQVLAPEVLRGQPLSPGADLYSLGVLLYRLATARYPVPGVSVAELVAAHDQHRATPLRDVRPDLPAAFVQAVERALAANPRDRFASAGEMERALAEVAGARAARRPPRRGLALAAAALAAAAAIAAAVRGLGLAAPPASRPIRSLAVLPLVNLAGDPEQQYLVDGMTDALISRLAQLESVKVISRTSAMRYAGTRQPLPDVARELGVDAVLEGSVLRAGGRVRVTARLVDGATDSSLWARDYESELSDALRLQADVSSAVAGEIRAALTPGARLRQSRRVEPAAYEAYLRGRYLLARRRAADIAEARRQFEQASALDPAYAAPHAGLADAYILAATFGGRPPREVLPRAREAALAALALDDSLADAHASLGIVRAEMDWDWTGEESELRRALELSPSHAEGHRRYSEMLSYRGRHPEAIHEGRLARDLDPFALPTNFTLGFALYHAKRYDEAAAQLRRTLAMDNGMWVCSLGLGLIHAHHGRYDDALAELEKGRQVGGDQPDLLAITGYVEARAGRPARARAMLAALAGLRRKQFVSAVDFALVRVALGDHEGALRDLEGALEERTWLIGLLKVEPMFDSLRAEPRFQDLLRRVHLDPGPDREGEVHSDSG